jgi:beta-barrel assembly-enhancing protease
MGSLKIRIIIALVIAGFSVISYFSSSSHNPITGEKQHISMSEEEEIAMGLQSAPEMASQFGGLSRNSEATALVEQLGNEVVQHSIAKTSKYQFNFHLLADRQTVNAFALPGGQVFITEALLSRLKTKAQLAGVLGHEVGHVLARHSAEHIAKQKLTSGLTTAAVIGVDPSGGGAQMAQMVAGLINMKYGRGDELEADKLGLRLMSEAGYEPRALIGVMEILAQASGGSGQPEFSSTHPSPENRMQKIEEELATMFPNGVPDGLKK